MRRYYIPAVLILILLSFFGGYYFGSRSGDVHIELSEIKKERDSLTIIITRTMNNTRRLEIAARAARGKYIQADSALTAERTAQASKQASNHKKIVSVVKLQESQLDSTLIALYPDSTRLSFNRHLRPISVKGWRLAAVIQDRYKLDSISDVSSGQGKIIFRLNESIDTRDRYIGELDNIISNKDTTITSVLAREQTHIAESHEWERVAKKYKRQRNGFIAGAAVVVLAVTIKTFFNPNP